VEGTVQQRGRGEKNDWGGPNRDQKTCLGKGEKRRTRSWGGITPEGEDFECKGPDDIVGHEGRRKNGAAKILGF